MSLIKKVFNFLKEKKYIISFTVVVLAILGVFVFRNKSTSEDTFVVSHSNFVNQVSVSGKVVAAQDVELGFKKEGRIDTVYIHKKPSETGKEAVIVKSGLKKHNKGWRKNA
jgi:multidrug efflux pump subunit AcrA (membrane-fusion protein)